MLCVWYLQVRYLNKRVWTVYGKPTILSRCFTCVDTQIRRFLRLLLGPWIFTVILDQVTFPSWSILPPPPRCSCTEYYNVLIITSHESNWFYITYKRLKTVFSLKKLVFIMMFVYQCTKVEVYHVLYYLYIEL